jgi:hypothetical protein
VRGSGSDQGGRWPVGIWFAMVGVSAGTVASFSLIGWTFARDLYGGGDGTVPLDYEPQTVVIEADETPDPIGVAGGDGGPVDPAGPGPEPQIGISAAEPRAERLEDAEVGAALPPEEPRGGPASEESAPPQLVPVGENEEDCGREESDPDPHWDGHWGDDRDDGRDWSSDGDRDRERAAYELPALDLDLELDESSIEIELELEPAS